MQIRLTTLLLAAAIPGMAQHPTLLALSKTNHTLAIIDPITLQVTAQIPVGADPHEVGVSPDGKTAYVSNTGSGRFHEINVIDLTTQKAMPAIETLPLYGPHGLAFADGKLYFTAEGSKAIGRYDPATGREDWVIGTGQDRTHMLQVTAEGKEIYATNVDAGTFSVLQNRLLPPPVTPMGYVLPTAKPSMGWVHTIIPVSPGSEGFDIYGAAIWTASPHDGKITVIDTAAKKVTSVIDAKIFGANRLRFTPDGKRILISSLKTGGLYIYDVKGQKEIKHISLGHGAAGIEVDPDGARAFISCTPDNYIAVVDLKTLTVIQHIDIGGRPDGITWVNKK